MGTQFIFAFLAHLKLNVYVRKKTQKVMKFVLICHMFSGRTWGPLIGQISIQIIRCCPTKFLTERNKDGKWMTGKRMGLKEPRC